MARRSRGRRGARARPARAAAAVLAVATAVASLSAVPARPALASPAHLVVGFNATSPALVSSAAAVGVTTDVLYAGAPATSSSLGRALLSAHMGVVDASISTDLFFWECHRTHTVALPPAGERNFYCRRDAEPTFTTAKLLSTVATALRADAVNPLVTGYWVLDDWASWDGGSARAVLQDIHGEIAAATPGLPAICGFGAAITAPGTAGWDASTGQNYSPQGCDMVGFYNYADAGRRASSGAGLDWSMRTLLPAMEGTLSSLGWSPTVSPLLGIGQAWSGRYAGGYEPGLSVAQIVAEAGAFCAGGATSIAWYGWTSGDFRRKTATPADSATIDAGITQAIATCRLAWSG